MAKAQLRKMDEIMEFGDWSEKGLERRGKRRNIWATKYSGGWTIYSSFFGILEFDLTTKDAKRALEHLGVGWEKF